MGILVDDKKVRYEVEQKDLTTQQSGWNCTVYVDDESIVSVDGVISREEVKTKAAHDAANILEERKRTAAK